MHGWSIGDFYEADPTALCSLLFFMTQQCKILDADMPCATFDHQFYVRAFESKSSMKIRIFVGLEQ